MAFQRILITGTSGFLGSALIQEVCGQDTGKNQFFSLGLKSSTGLGSEKLTHFPCNLEEKESVERAIQLIQPDRVYHLAGVSQVSRLIDFNVYFRGNFLQTRNLLEALAQIKKPIRFLFASSVHVYGNQPGTITENLPIMPESPYGFTKFLAEEALRQFCKEDSRRDGLVIRLSSCLGPGQGPGFVAGDFALKIKKALNENLSVINTGPLNTHRQFMDKRDVAKAFDLLMTCEKIKAFEVFNLASPHRITTAELLEEFLKSAGAKLKVESTLPIQNSFVGLEISPAKFLEIAPQFTFRPLKETVQDMLNYSL